MLTYVSGIALFGAILFALLAILSWPRFEAWRETRHTRGAKPGNGKEDADLGTATGRPEPGIKTPGIYIYATPDRIVIWTTIKLVDKHGRETYLKNLTTSNFSILESYSGNTYKAPALEVKSSHVPVRAILVIDKSGSMNEASGVDGYKKMDVVKEAANIFVDQLLGSGGNSIAVLPFAGENVDSSSFLKGSKGDIWSGKNEEGLLEGAINRLEAGGNTPLWQAIEVALDELSKAGGESYKVVICLSDGMNNRGATTATRLFEKVRHKQIPIFTIGYGGEGKLNDQELIQLSDESGAGKPFVGSFIRVSPRDLSSRLQAIGTDLSNLYELYWEPTGARPGTNVAVEIEITYDSGGEHFKTRAKRSYIFPQRE